MDQKMVEREIKQLEEEAETSIEEGDDLVFQYQQPASWSHLYKRARDLFYRKLGFEQSVDPSRSAEDVPEVDLRVKLSDSDREVSEKEESDSEDPRTEPVFQEKSSYGGGEPCNFLGVSVDDLLTSEEKEDDLDIYSGKERKQMEKYIEDLDNIREGKIYNKGIY